MMQNSKEIKLDIAQMSLVALQALRDDAIYLIDLLDSEIKFRFVVVDGDTRIL